jgi:hypothetical protein
MRREKVTPGRRRRSRALPKTTVAGRARESGDDDRLPGTKRRKAAAGGRARAAKRGMVEQGADSLGGAPFDELVRLRLLAPGDALLGLVLAAAGERYRSLWRDAGRANIPSTAQGKKKGASAFAAPAVTRRDAARQDAYRRAREALPPEQRRVLDEVLLAEVDLATAGRNASGRRDEQQAIAIAIDRLACGCAILARHFGLLSRA